MRIPTWWPALSACAMLLPSSGVAQERVPLCAGLTIVGAVSEPEGDYEPIITFDEVDTAGVRLRYTADVRTRSGAIRKVDVRRMVRREDLDSATMTMPWFDDRAAVTMPGTTAIGISRAVLRALKAALPGSGCSTQGAAAIPPGGTCSRICTSSRGRSCSKRSRAVPDS
jgi:hypothetical protein